MYAGTAVAMEKEPGILKEEHKAIVEALRDQIEKDLQQYKEAQGKWVQARLWKTIYQTQWYDFFFLLLW